LEACDLVYQRILPVQQEAWFRATLAAAQRLNEKRAEGRSVISLAMIAVMQAETPIACTNARQALALLRAVGDSQGELQALGVLGAALQQNGDLQEALHIFQQLTQQAQVHRDRKALWQGLASLADVYTDLGAAQQAQISAQAALRLVQQLGQRQAEALVLNTLGRIANDLEHNLPQARSYYEQSLILFREVQDRQGEAQASWNLAEVLLATGDLAGAAEAMQITVAYEELIASPLATEDAARLADVLAQMRSGEQP
jgi:tetratricopeptide (TPR) repeat protein